MQNLQSNNKSALHGWLTLNKSLTLLFMSKNPSNPAVKWDCAEARRPSTLR